MQDLTQGSIARHLLSMAVFIGAGLAFQAAYFLVDLYFVAAIGPDAIAGVSAAGNTSFLVMAAAQLVGVGVTSLVARAIGRRDEADARLVFNQSLGMAAIAGIVTLVVGYAVAARVVAALTANAGSAAAGTAYLRAYLPSLGVMFPMTALIASLRGAGVVRPTMLVQTGAVLVNALLAPVLIAGWITHYPLGTAGAGLASSIAGVGALLALVAAYPRIQPSFSASWALLAPRLRLWWEIVSIGLPVAGEFAMMFVITTVVYWVIRHFGAPAQAGFGIGSRIMTSIFLPAMAVAFAVAPVAGQNMGARRPDRVRATFFRAALLSSIIMIVLSVICHSRPDLLIAVFTRDPAVMAVAAQYLRIASWNFVAVGLVFVCSGMFQAMGNTVPSFISSASRLVTYVVPAVVLTGRFDLATLWYMSVGSTTLQAVISLLLLRRELGVRLGGAGASIKARPGAEPLALPSHFLRLPPRHIHSPRKPDHAALHERQQRQDRHSKHRQRNRRLEPDRWVPMAVGQDQERHHHVQHQENGDIGREVVGRVLLIVVAADNTIRQHRQIAAEQPAAPAGRTRSRQAARQPGDEPGGRAQARIGGLGRDRIERHRPSLS